MLLEAAASIEGMCCEVFYIAYKMTLRYQPQWRDRVLNLLTVSFFSLTVVVLCLLHQPVVPGCSILLEYDKESEKPSPRPLLTLHDFAQL